MFNISVFRFINTNNLHNDDYFGIFALDFMYHLIQIVMEKISSFGERISSISFVEVKVFPPQSERFYQLIRDGNPTRYVYSESQLFNCLGALEIKFGL